MKNHKRIIKIKIIHNNNDLRLFQPVFMLTQNPYLPILLYIYPVYQRENELTDKVTVRY